MCGLHGSARSLKAALCSWEPRHCSYRKRWERGVGRRAVGPPRELSTRKPPPVRTGRAESGPLDPARCLLCCYTCGGCRGGTAVASETVPREGELCCWAGPRSAPMAQRGCLEGRQGEGLAAGVCCPSGTTRCWPASPAWADSERSTASHYMNVYFIRTDTDHDI